MQEENEKLNTAIEQIKDFNPNALEVQNQIFNGYLLNCAKGVENLTEEAILHHQLITNLLKSIN